MRASTAILLCVGFVATAVFLRFGHGNIVREAITHALGFDTRAIVEHLLAGAGIPLLLAWLKLGVWYWLEVCWQWIRSRVLSLEQKEVSSWMTLAGQWGLPFVTAVFGVAYIGGSYLYELGEAQVSVYGGPPRGYFQVPQFRADIASAAVSILIAIVVAMDHRLSTNCQPAS